ncbi:MAG: hydrogenase formation protein HypD [Thermoplasmata archaeon]|nr:MAG: hydrogenase formation protein HypD [Thermoplasmata archaeon]
MFKFRDKEIAQKAIANLETWGLDIKVMHVCGGHQDTLIRYGLDDMLKNTGIDVRQGPGCPVCVTTAKEIEEAMVLARAGKTFMVFGDMMRVPGKDDTLFDLKGKGADIKMVYSIDDAVKFAEQNPGKEVVFMSIGFETTAPSTAAVLNAGVPDNFAILCTHRYVPPALKGIIELGEVKLNGLIEPGHVSTIIGTKPYEFLSKDYGVPQVVTGFEPLDLLMGFYMVAKQVKEGRAEIENEYSRVVQTEGNPKAIAVMNEVLEPYDVAWRGFGIIPGSGMKLKSEYEQHDARLKYEDILKELEGMDFSEPKGCRCGEVLRGLIDSRECPMFGKACNPANPIGPCMVTAEGSCNIVYKYKKNE